MVSVQLKAKHFYYILYCSKSGGFSNIRNLYKGILAIPSTTLDEDLVTIDASQGEVTHLYDVLTNMPEGQANVINTEMYSTLTPQIEAGVQAGNQEWVAIAQAISDIRATNLGMTNRMIEAGKQLAGL